ncbi:MAG TPA: hypothetical protein VI300_14240, partial [Solirubrobacter sp.]
MEVVVLLFAIAGAALIVVPRLQRRKAAAHRPAAKRFKGAARPARARKANVAAASGAAVASWSPPAADADGWEDDLGWEGEDAAEPSEGAREAWEQWRATESPLAAAAASPDAPEVEPEAPELPSVERWRAQAAEQDEWVEDDDDGLGWEGDDEPPAPRALWNAETPAPVAPEWSPAPPSPSSEGWNSGRDWSRTQESASTAPAFASASATDVAAPASSDAAAPEPQAGRTIALDDDEWAAPVGRSWGAAPAGADATPRRSSSSSSSSSRRSRVHPVVLVALYAAIGIGAVVLASTFLLGGSEPSPASVKSPPAPSATPSATPTPVATPQASPTPDPA